MGKRERLQQVIQEMMDSLNPIAKAMITPYLATMLQNNDDSMIDSFIDTLQAKIDYIKSGDVVDSDND